MSQTQWSPPSPPNSEAPSQMSDMIEQAKSLQANVEYPSKTNQLEMMERLVKESQFGNDKVIYSDLFCAILLSIDRVEVFKESLRRLYADVI